MNKLGYSPLQLVTGQAVMIPGLTTGNEATESMTDSEAVRRIMENLMKIIRAKESKIKYGYLGDKDDLVIIGLGDTSYKQDDKTI